MIRVAVAEWHVRLASEFYEFGALNNSIMAGQSNVYGALGEVIFGELYPECRKVESFDYDFVAPNGRTIDIKTKRTTAIPQPDWNCSVAATSKHQKPDFFFFIRVSEDLATAWLLGWLSHDDFYATAVFRRKGDPDPAKPDWRFRADCWNVQIGWLREPPKSNAH